MLTLPQSMTTGTQRSFRLLGSSAGCTAIPKRAAHACDFGATNHRLEQRYESSGVPPLADPPGNNASSEKPIVMFTSVKSDPLR